MFLLLVGLVPSITVDAFTPGSLDTTFDNDGLVTTDFGNSDQGQGVAIQSDGKIVVAGQSNVGGTDDFALARYMPDGSLDPSFDTDGLVTTDFGGDAQVAYAVAIQSDGKIVAAGSDATGNNFFALARYNSNGSLDTSFDGDGRVTTDMGGNDEVLALVIQRDGKIVVAGRASDELGIARYTTGGSLDTSFSGDGRDIVDIGTNAQGRGLAIQPAAMIANDKIVVAGRANLGGATLVDFVVLRYTNGGVLDSTFDGEGIVTTDFGGTTNTADEANGVAIQSDGKIVAAGASNASPPGTGTDYALARYNDDGSLDTTFDGDGKVRTNSAAVANDVATAVAIQPDGKIVIAGRQGPNFGVARYNSNGTLDTSFDGDGLVSTDFGVPNSMAEDLALQPDGRIVAAGWTTANDFAVARYGSSTYFDHQFDDGVNPTTYGWKVDTFGAGTPNTSDWQINNTGNKYYETTSATAFGWSSVSYAAEPNLTNMDYEVEMTRLGVCMTCANSLYARGEPLPFVTTQNRWQRGYQFSISLTSPARYAIFMFNGLSTATLQPWTPVVGSPVINPIGTPNKLRVKLLGSTLRFVINGTEVAATPLTNTALATGKVGIALSRSTGAGLNDVLQVNYATATPYGGLGAPLKVGDVDFQRMSPEQRRANREARREYRLHPERFGTPEMAPE